MAYTKENKLKRIIDIQAIFKEHFKNGTTIEWVYRNKIKDQFRISKRTFNNYLQTPAETQLKKLQSGQQIKAKYKQATMDFFNQQP